MLLLLVCLVDFKFIDFIFLLYFVYLIHLFNSKSTHFDLLKNLNAMQFNVLLIFFLPIYFCVFITACCLTLFDKYLEDTQTLERYKIGYEGVSSSKKN